MKKKTIKKIKNIYIIVITIVAVTSLALNFLDINLKFFEFKKTKVDIEKGNLEKEKLKFEVSKISPKFEEHFLILEESFAYSFLTKQGFFIEDKDIGKYPYVKYPVVKNKLYMDMEKNTGFGQVTSLVIEQKGAATAEEVKLIAAQLYYDKPFPGSFYPETLDYALGVYDPDKEDKGFKDAEIVEIDLGNLDTNEGIVVPLYNYARYPDLVNHEENLEKYKRCEENPIMYSDSKVYGRFFINNYGSIASCGVLEFGIGGYIYVPIKIKFLDSSTGKYKEDDIRDMFNNPIQLHGVGISEKG